LAAAQKQAQQWSVSALFERVDLHVAADLDQLRQELRRMDQAGLPPQAREALAGDPQAWFGQRAQRIMAPLGEQTLIAADEDWLGFAYRLSGKLQASSAVHYDVASNTMRLEADNRIWYVMRAQLDAADQSGRDEQLLALIDQTQQQAAQQDV